MHFSYNVLFNLISSLRSLSDPETENECKKRDRKERGRREKEEAENVPYKRNNSPGWVNTIFPRPEDGVPVNSPVLHTNTSSHYYCFLHHVGRPVSYRHGGWQQNHCRPITLSPTVISNSCFLIINIILTYFNDAPNSAGVQQCTLSVPGNEHSVAHENNLTTLETNPILRDDTSGPNYITGTLLHLHH